MNKTCAICGQPFGCGADDPNGRCWCNDFPKFMPMDAYDGCLCPDCFKQDMQRRIADFVARAQDDPKLRDELQQYDLRRDRLIEGIDYDIEDGRWVFTAWYHLKRGSCCGNGCRHCPYGNAPAA